MTNMEAQAAGGITMRPRTNNDRTRTKMHSMGIGASWARQDFTNRGDESEDFKTMMRVFLKSFKSSAWSQQNVCLPTYLSRDKLEFVAQEAARNGLSTALVTQNDRENQPPQQQLCVSKMGGIDIGNSFLNLSHESEETIQRLLRDLCVNSKNQVHGPGFIIESGKGSKLQVSKQWKVPKPKVIAEFDALKQSLPIYKYRYAILNSIMINRITLIKGDPGVGKSTQVPQFILDDAANDNRNCQIIATVPQRLTAKIVAERVAAERGETIGGSIGYQVRLESKVSPCNSVLTFCTNDILLRSLGQKQQDNDILKYITHIIIDDVNERDEYMDLLLTCLRELLSIFPKLRIILMGTDVLLDQFTAFFGTRNSYHCTIAISKPYFPVKTYFFEEIIELPCYTETYLNVSSQSSASSSYFSYNDQRNQELEFEEDEPLTDRTRRYVDGLLEKVFKLSCKDSASKLIQLVISKNISVNYKHSVTRVPILSCFAISKFAEEVKLMLQLGADPELTISNAVDSSFVARLTARDFAVKSNDKSTIDQFITERQYVQAQALDNSFRNLKMNDAPKSKFKNCSLSTHVVKIIHEIHKEEDRSGSILVFLKDYDEIIEVMDMLHSSTTVNKSELSIFVMHPEMQYEDQKGVFRSPPERVRKVILSADIGETSFTFSDVCFVIDGGRNSKKSWSGIDSDDGNVTQWISKTSANQRTAYAGCTRPGKCFRVYTGAQYESMSCYAVPQILTSSLQHLCLMARCLIPLTTKISSFLRQVPNPPDILLVERTVKILQEIEALNDHEELTDLGNHMIDYPVEPQLAKALFYSIAMKCVDPILTIVATLHHGDPFLSVDRQHRSQSMEYKNILGRGQHSDHYAMLKLFQQWETETFDKNGPLFCTQHGLRVSTFDKISTTRTLLLAQLRASGFVKSDIRELNEHSKHWGVVKAVLTAARYPNLGHIDRLSETITLGARETVGLHFSSVIFIWSDILNLKSEWILFDELLTNAPKQMRGCSVVTPMCVALFGGGACSLQNSLVKQPGFPRSLTLHVGDRLSLHGSESSVQLITKLRASLRVLILKILRNPHGSTSPMEAEVVQRVAEILRQEEHKIGLADVDVGQWPMFVGANMMAPPQCPQMALRSSHSAYRRPRQGFQD